MSKLYSLIDILDVTAANCVEALASSISDYEDAVVEKVVASKEMDYMVTRNIKDYQEGTVKVTNAKEECGCLLLLQELWLDSKVQGNRNG